MAKITQITIVDENTLRLEVDAQKGDEIDLLSLNEFDTSYIRKLIEEGKEKEYNKRLSEEKNKFQLILETEILKNNTSIKEQYENKLEEYKKKLLELEKENEMISKSIDEKSTLKANEEIKKYLEQINKLEQEKNNLKNEYDIRVLKLEQNIKEASLKVDSLLEAKEQEYKEQILKLEIEHKEKLHEKENEITRLQNDRTVLNSKHIGDDLEDWCNNEMISYSQTGFINCDWYKDTIAVKEDGETKGTKGDYIFRVYNNEAHTVELTSVLCEMKSEDPLAKNPKTNSSHYSKLDKDRNKKNCEYALLVSELEWEHANDIPIMKVRGYDKMYMVRPQYFISFLSVIENLANKYKELIVRKELEEAKFEKTNEILEKFEKFKDDLINTLIERIIKSVTDIHNKAKTIRTAAEAILETTNKIVETQIEAVKNKITKFDIVKLTKSINKLNQPE